MRLAEIPAQQRWLLSYARQALSWARIPDDRPRHVLFCLADHFEPGGEGIPVETMVARVDRWMKLYPGIARRHRDSNGVSPRHSFFYPAEQYRPEVLERLAQLTHEGWGEVEIHLHHDRDSASRLRERIEEFKARLVSHALLGREPAGDVRYGFIHGNWALDNSDTLGRWCGVDGELLVLRETGCYADFTLPSAPSATQTRKINAIYYATGHPGKSKSHDTGVDVCVNGKADGHLLLIQGPLVVDWRRRKFGILPRIDAGAITPSNPGTGERVRLWLRRRIHVRGRPEWLVVKVHAHGVTDGADEFFLNGGLHDLWSALESESVRAPQYRLHYVTARELYNIVKAAEAGLTGDPSAYRDYQLRLPK